MKTRILATVLFVAVSMMLPSHAAAQQPVEVLVYDSCYPYYWGLDTWEWAMTCDSHVTTVDGSKGGLVAAGVVAPAVSPDGGRIAYAGPGMVVVNLSDWSSAMVSPVGDSPAWSPDGTKIAFAAGALYVMSADGSGVTQVPNTALGVDHPAWSPDGATIAFDCEVDSGNRDICAINIDGTGLMRLTSHPDSDSDAAYAPDGLTIAFSTSRYGGSQIALMNPDGAGVRQLGGGTSGGHASWSPDGTRIAFGVTYTPEGIACPADGSICWGALEQHYLVVVNADGSGGQVIGSGRNPGWAIAVRPVASFSAACNELSCAFDGSRSWGGNGSLSYAWDFGDGTTAVGAAETHNYAAAGTYSVTLTVEDGTGVMGAQQRSVVVVGDVPPAADFIFGCSARQCTFDASTSSDANGPLVMYHWSFGDGETAGTTHPVQTHTYTAHGDFVVTLTVTDDAGNTASRQQVVKLVNALPVPLFTTSCDLLTCTLNGSGSFDSDGTIASYAWTFGDNTTGSGASVSHSYPAAGSYTVALTVTDNNGASSTRSHSVTTIQPRLHVGDLDSAISTQNNAWTVTITIAVHDGAEAGIANATVTGRWNDGSSSTCTTNATGRCAVSKPGIAKKTRSVAWSVTSVVRTPYVYASGSNHDPDGDSDGSGMTVLKP
jgi:PKD repeat protein